jgi:hypothetical protein
LEEMEIPPVDERQVHPSIVAQLTRRVQPSEPAAYDDDAVETTLRLGCVRHASTIVRLVGLVLAPSGLMV